MLFSRDLHWDEARTFDVPPGFDELQERAREIVPAQSTNLFIGASYAISARGRVFAFSDEWVTYTSQWLGNPNATVNQYDSCYDAASGLMKTADHVFQVPQFWYNAIGWVANKDCGFTIDDPAIIK